MTIYQSIINQLLVWGVLGGQRPPSERGLFFSQTPALRESNGLQPGVLGKTSLVSEPVVHSATVVPAGVERGIKSEKTKKMDKGEGTRSERVRNETNEQ